MNSLNANNRSAGYARDRMKLLLNSERIGCSPQMMTMLKNDLVHTVKKYLSVDETKVRIRITSKDSLVLHADIPVRSEKE
ncbi:MAG: cell division topological specificity factor MinE [Blautia sp.]|nr:cell division topological specificity factor MinE [Candidatus Blautia excrementigallinarum]